jgi:hypothetical protein
MTAAVGQQAASIGARSVEPLTAVKPLVARDRSLAV